MQGSCEISPSAAKDERDSFCRRVSSRARPTPSSTVKSPIAASSTSAAFSAVSSTTSFQGRPPDLYDLAVVLLHSLLVLLQKRESSCSRVRLRKGPQRNCKQQQSTYHLFLLFLGLEGGERICNTGGILSSVGAGLHSRESVVKQQYKSRRLLKVSHSL